MFILERDEHNPLLSPKTENSWEASGSFNWCPVDKNIAVYRAQSSSTLKDGMRRAVSTIAIAKSQDGIHYDDRKQLIVPEHDWEKFGCEDPRVTKVGKEYYIFYTALSTYPFRAEGIKIGLAKANGKMEITDKYPITPFNAKAMGLFSKKINGKFAALLTIKTDEPPSEICYVEFDKESDMWSSEFWQKWRSNIDPHKLNIRRSDNDQVELGAPPLYTAKGWLVIYSHIQGYFHGNRTFGTEALLLDLDDPRKIIARTKGSIIVPEEYYEHVGHVPNIIFPSGSATRGKILEIYYGAADTHGCIARANLDKFLNALVGKKTLLKRSPNNPIIAPRPDVAFETKGTLNPASVDVGGKVHIFYRAVSDKNVSTLGYAVSKDGTNIDKRLAEPVYIPRAEFEKPGGCEDPRATVIGDRVYMLYTAYDGNTPRIAGTSISTKDLLNQKWNWEMPKLVTISSITNKDGCVFPKKINGKYMIIHRLDDMVCADFIDSLDWEDEPVRSCISIIGPRQGMWDGAKVGLASPPIETRKGWLLFYHGVSHTTHYRVGVALLDLKDPTKILARSALPIFEPIEEYEWQGTVPGVVFPCGIVCRGNTIFLYYGAADFVVGVATAKVSEILDTLTI